MDLLLGFLGCGGFVNLVEENQAMGFINLNWVEYQLYQLLIYTFSFLFTIINPYTQLILKVTLDK